MIARPGKRLGQRPKSGFTYKPRPPEAARKRAERQGGQFDMPYQSGFDTYRAKANDNLIRFLPPTWDDADHFGLVVHTHRFIGADGGTYLCLRKMLGKRCAICDASRDAKDAGEEEDAKQMAPAERVLFWIIDRDGDDSNPVLYDISWTMDRDIVKLTQSKRDGSVLQIDHPEEGFDFSFTRHGQGVKTKYAAFAFDRDPSPIDGDPRRVDEILAFIEKNPLPSVLLYHTNEYLEKVLAGTAKARDELEDEIDDLEPQAEDETAFDPPPRREAREEKQPRARLEREPRRSPDPVYEEDIPYDDEADIEQETSDQLPDSYNEPAEYVDELEPEQEYEPEPPPQRRVAREPARAPAREPARPAPRQTRDEYARPTQRIAAPQQRPVQRAQSRYDDEAPRQASRPVQRTAAPASRPVQRPVTRPAAPPPQRRR